MARIKVTVNSLDQANELIEYWNDKDVELLVDVKPKENTTMENSDVKCFGNSDNPMTKKEWTEHNKNSKKCHSVYPKM